MAHKDAASREVNKTLSSRVSGQFRHRTTDRQLFQGPAKVFLAGEYAGHAIERIPDLYLLVGGRGFLISHIDMPPHNVIWKKQILSVDRKTAAPENAVSAYIERAVSRRG